MHSFFEITRLNALKDELSRVHSRVVIENLSTVTHRRMSFPIDAISIGNPDSKAPVLGFIGGVHGLERIGSQVILSYLETLSSRLKWDQSFHALLERVRMVFVPVVNPFGIMNETRSNANGVDLMRNAPVVADGASFLVGGHRISKHLPWYRGLKGAEMEVEAKALCEFVRKQTDEASFAFILDVHSGFGTRDRLWFPYAKNKTPPVHLPEYYRLNQLLNHTLPNHVYQLEPQSLSYTTHGDLWDYLYDLHLRKSSKNLFLPLTLEIGSWLWVKKNPLQLFSFLGPFHPVKAHRKKRVLRRHLPFFDFLERLTFSNEKIFSLKEVEKAEYRMHALKDWYEDREKGIK